MKKLDLGQTQIDLVQLSRMNDADTHDIYGCIYSITACILAVVVKDDNNGHKMVLPTPERQQLINPSIANQMAFQFNYCPICGKDLREGDN